MTWVKIDDGFAQHPKVVAAGPLAMAMQVAALCYCNRELTDGFIPRAVARTLLDWSIEDDDGRVYTIGVASSSGAEDVTCGLMIDILLETGMWEAVPGGYRIHDYLDYQPSKHQVLLERDHARTRKELYADRAVTDAVKQRDQNRCRYCGQLVNWSDRRGGRGGTLDHVVPISAGGRNGLDNIVVACRACNSSKGPRTPDQAGMALLEPGSMGRNQFGTSSGSERSSSNPDKNYPPVPVPVPDQSDSSLRSESNTNGADAPSRESLPDGFAAFWEAYGKKVEKKAAVDAWRRLKPDAALQATILAAIERQKEGRKWREGFVKDPHRWLNGRNWTDEVEPPARRLTTIRGGRANGAAVDWSNHSAVFGAEQ